MTSSCVIFIAWAEFASEHQNPTKKRLHCFLRWSMTPHKAVYRQHARESRHENTTKKQTKIGTTSRETIRRIH